MNIEEKERFIRQKANEHVPVTKEKIYWSLHAVRKLRLEGLRKKSVENCLRQCVAIEDYPAKTRTLQDCLVLGFVGSDPLHSVIAIDKDFDRILVITVYRPSTDRWENDWKKRKR
jgi:hypothetical protein